jgi:hypothetical protein
VSILDFADGRSSPRFEVNRLPPEERKPTLILEGTLNSLHAYCDDFAAAIHLFDFCEKNIEQNKDASANLRRVVLWQSWQKLAGRDGAMTIFHFGKALAGAGMTLGSCPTIRRGLDATKLRSARKLFNQKFPRNEDARHAVAHAGELWSTPAKVDKNIAREPRHMAEFMGCGIDELVVRDSFVGGRFTNTFEGKVISYELNRLTLSDLEHVKYEFYSAFLTVPELRPC